MNELKVISHNGQLVTESRIVAEIVGRRHSDVMRTINGYVETLENAKVRYQDFFIKSSYRVDGNIKTYDCYLLTRKGCDMVANKMTGEKGVLFTAAYVTEFEEMENQLTKPMSQAELILMQAQNVLELEQKVEKHDSKITLIEKKVDEQITLQLGEQRRLQRAVAARVYELHEDKEERPQAFASLHREIKDRFGVASYRDVRRQDLQDAINYVEHWIPRKVAV